MSDDFDADLNVDTSNYDVKASGYVDAAGVYQMAVMEWKKEVTKTGSVAVAFELTAQHTVEGQSPAGSKLMHRVWLRGPGGEPAKEGAVTSAVNFFVGLGVMKRESRDGKEVGVSLVDGTTNMGKAVFDAACNKVCWAEVKENAPKPAELKLYPNARTKYELPYGTVHPLDSHRFCRNPGDDAIADIAGYVRVNGAYQKKGSEAPRVAAAPKSTEFSDI